MAPKYTKLYSLGSGSYGSAWVIYENESTDRKVMKEVKLLNLSERDVDQALSEVAALARCKHENIIRYYDAFVDESTVILSIIMDYASEGDLHKHISQRRGLYFPNETIVTWFTQLLSALMYIHKRGILHRDIKPQNLFLNNKRVLKLGDFGICKIFKKETDVAVTMIGTPFYLSPEICQHKPYSYKSDMWSAGCVLYELCCLRVPFTAPNMPSLIAQILAGVYNPLPSHCSQTLCDGVQKLLVPDPDRRPSAEEILQSLALLNQEAVGEQEQPAKDKARESLEEISKTRNGKKRAQSMLNCEDSTGMAKKEKHHQGFDQKSIDSTTYTVVRHPKLRHLSPASSPELSLLLERQRNVCSWQQTLEERRVQSVEALPSHRRKHKKASAPRFNLLRAAVDMKPKANEGDMEIIEQDCEPSEFNATTLRRVTETVYKFYIAPTSLQKKQSIAEIWNQLLSVLGPSRLASVVAAARAKCDCAALTRKFYLGQGVVQAVLWYLTLSELL